MSYTDGSCISQVSQDLSWEADVEGNSGRVVWGGLGMLMICLHYKCV